MLGAAEVGGAPQPNEDGGANEGVGKDGWNGVDVGNEEKSADIGAAYDVGAPSAQAPHEDAGVGAEKVGVAKLGVEYASGAGLWLY
jgi:hypothetical protein